jgi:hypothetical protein
MGPAVGPGADRGPPFSSLEWAAPSKFAEGSTRSNNEVTGIYALVEV